jgi:hypothetical protein
MMEIAMVETFLVENVWLTAALWAAIYISDYYTTIYAARLYRMGANQHVFFQGSIELTPVFQDDVDKLRKLSGKFLLRLALTTTLMIVVWFFSRYELETDAVFLFFSGSFFLLEAVVHIRHIRNIFLFRHARDSQNIKGTIEYSRWVILRQSGMELFVFTIFFLLISVISGSWFFLGGAFGCLATGRKHWFMSKKFKHQTEKIFSTETS